MLDNTKKRSNSHPARSMLWCFGFRASPTLDDLRESMNEEAPPLAAIQSIIDFTTASIARNGLVGDVRLSPDTLQELSSTLVSIQQALLGQSSQGLYEPDILGERDAITPLAREYLTCHLSGTGPSCLLALPTLLLAVAQMSHETRLHISWICHW
jgi:hypothetical protein